MSISNAGYVYAEVMLVFQQPTFFRSVSATARTRQELLAALLSLDRVESRPVVSLREVAVVQAPGENEDGTVSIQISLPPITVPPTPDVLRALGGCPIVLFTQGYERGVVIRPSTFRTSRRLKVSGREPGENECLEITAPLQLVETWELSKDERLPPEEEEE
jgi:hypothetical protein